MSNSSIVRLRARVTISKDEWNKFLQMVEDVKNVVQIEGKENTLTHQTYKQSGTFKCLIVEAYKDEQAFLRHLENIKPIADKYRLNWEVNEMELAGPYSDETINAMKAGSNVSEFYVFETPLS